MDNATEMKNRIDRVTPKTSPKEVEQLLADILKLPDITKGGNPDKVLSIENLSLKLHLPIDLATTRGDDRRFALSGQSHRIQNWIDNKRADKRANKMVWWGIIAALAALASAIFAGLSMWPDELKVCSTF